ncbi:MAG: hypothetical protein Q8Q46_01155 [Candidatus Giovannonibacteria bacterium]|nr:hypothetical protein [Candidatus Giovannonibacteria bacterium]
MYNVVFVTIVECSTKGVITWTSFRDKEHFDKWYDKKTQGWYEVVDQGVSRERALELCSTQEAKNAYAVSAMKRLSKLFLQQLR